MARHQRRGRRTANRHRKRNETAKAVRNILIVVLLVGIVAFFYFRSVLANRTLDEETMCPTDVDAVTAVIVDVTDPLNTPQRQDFRNQLDGLLAKIQRYEKLVIFKVDPVGDALLIPVLVRCNPGSASDVSEIDGNPQKLEAAHQSSFVEPMKMAFEGLMEATSADRSPVMESIQSVALSEFQSSDLEGKQKRLIVASDLLQNTDRVSFYRGLPEVGQFVESQAFNRVRTDLNGVEVELWMLQRDDSTQTQPRALPDFWDAIINEQGGRVTRVYRVSG